VSDLPKVSAVLPACYGDMALMAVQSFLAQTYSGELELIILDNNADGHTIEDKLPTDSRIQYHRVARQPVGALRNAGNALATGDIIANWDADDWSHPERIGQQVGRLLGTGKSVTGYHSIYYYANGATYKYYYEPNRTHPPYACGSSQTYLKSWWDAHPYPTTGIEDFAFQSAALYAHQLDSVDGAELLVARAHSDSVCYPTQLGKHRQFPAVPKTDLPSQFYDAIAPKAVASTKNLKTKSKSTS
jgi:glycosyltransferase involved in cell wall biosynthesis